ncbi:MAG: carboxypeptidase Y-deficient, partial [Watsoniomyces obsoletus]
EIEVQQQDEVKDWFKQQMVKAKKFQPLAVLNQKLKGLEVFESNSEVTRSSTSGAATPTQIASARTGSVDSAAAIRSATASPQPPIRPVAEVIDPDELVDKKHWQRRSGYDACSDPTCNKRLG